MIAYIVVGILAVLVVVLAALLWRVAAANVRLWNRLNAPRSPEMLPGDVELAPWHVEAFLRERGDDQDVLRLGADWLASRAKYRRDIAMLNIELEDALNRAPPPDRSAGFTGRGEPS